MDLLKILGSYNPVSKVDTNYQSKIKPEESVLVNGNTSANFFVSGKYNPTYPSHEGGFNTTLPGNRKTVCNDICNA